jgi:hypothetical protein
MVSFSWACVSGPHRAGSYGYAYTEDNRPRGRVCRVDHDSSAWFYRVEKGETVAFKQWALSVFAPNNGESYHVTGAFPFYTIERKRNAK